MNSGNGRYTGPDIITVTETWLREGQDRELKDAGYQCYRHDNSENKKRDGIAFPICENITAILWKIILRGLSSEIIRVEFKSKKMTTFMGLYTSPPIFHGIRGKGHWEIIGSYKSTRVVIARRVYFASYWLGLPYCKELEWEWIY